MSVRRWTVLVVPEGVGSSQQLTISARAVRWAMGLGAVLALVSGTGLYMAVTTAIDRSHVGRLQNQNDALERQLADMQVSVDRLNSTIVSITEQDEQVRLLAGLEPNDPDVQQAGVGGPAAPLSGGDSVLLDFRAGNEALAMRETVEGLSRRAEFLLGSFSDAVDTIADYREVLSRTPSIKPTPGFVSSGFSRSRMHPVLNYARAHQGVDLVAPRGTPIVAPAAGRVVDVSTQLGYGKIVTIEHGDGVQTRYAHCSEILVREGQAVERGDEIARVGRTGIATNYHLHYEVLVDGRHVDPRNYILPDVVVD